jgi:hypothetical protein
MSTEQCGRMLTAAYVSIKSCYLESPSCRKIVLPSIAFSSRWLGPFSATIAAWLAFLGLVAEGGVKVANITLLLLRAGGLPPRDTALMAASYLGVDGDDEPVGLAAVWKVCIIGHERQSLKSFAVRWSLSLEGRRRRTKL